MNPEKFLTHTNYHPSWHNILAQSLHPLSASYLQQLVDNNQWLPGISKVFAAFSQPFNQVKYILFGESPYPRAASANGYAFWDAAVDEIWSNTGLSKPVNKATSLRNFIKMLLVTHGKLSASDTSQAAIAKINKQHLVATLHALFQRLSTHGFLLLNTSLVLSEKSVQTDAKQWRPFVISLLEQLALTKPDIKLILLGNIAKSITNIPCTKNFLHICAEHPYNVSFINNQTVQNFFRPFELLNETI